MARVSLSRNARVTLGVAALGGVAGGLAGGLSAVVVGAMLGRNIGALFDWLLFLIGAQIGAPLGAVLLPVAAWTVMRHVPFGKALAGTVVGTLVGGFAGWFTPIGPNELLRSIAGGILGFSVAALWLRFRALSGREASPTFLP